MLILKTAKTSKGGAEKAAQSQAPPTQSPPSQPKAPELKHKKLKIAILAIVLILIIAAVLLFVLLYKPPGGTETQAPTAGSALTSVGTPGATATLSKEGATDAAIESAFVTGNEEAHVFCRQLGSGDKVATSGDDDKYSVVGPTWFVYADEEPGAWFEHSVKYIFIDASTGQKQVYQESWPPDINSEDMFVAAEGCGGVTTIYAS